jgi:hypothetical protein
MIGRQYDSVKKENIYHQIASGFFKSKEKKKGHVRVFSSKDIKAHAYLYNKIKSAKRNKDKEEDALFAGIYKSDKFTIEAAHKAFAKFAKS